MGGGNYCLVIHYCRCFNHNLQSGCKDTKKIETAKKLRKKTGFTDKG